MLTEISLGLRAENGITVGLGRDQGKFQLQLTVTSVGTGLTEIRIYPL